MNRREKMLAAAVGALVLLAVLNVGFKRIVKQFTDRSEKITKLQTEIETKQTTIHRGRIAQRTLKACSERSLPSNAQLANTRYRAWLHEWVKKAKIQGEDVKWVRSTPIKDASDPTKKAHDRHTFTVSCEATLPQLVDLLYRFYAVDLLHRIEFAKMVPADGNQLSVNFTIEAIGMPDAPADFALTDRPSNRLAFDRVEDYQNAIVARNFYGRGNQPPKFTSSASQRGFVGQPLDVTLKADDPDKNSVRYRLEQSDIEGLRIDERSGRIDWTPSQTGEFEVQVAAIDDGIPAKEVAQTVRLEISEPPKPAERPVRRTFDEAKYTYVTGIVEVNGRRQVWLSVRSEGKWLRLYEGETFQVGQFEGKIVKIHTRHVEIESQDTVWSVRYGQSLGDGEELKSGSSVAAAQQLQP